MSRTGAAFSVRFLRNGDQITIIRDIIDQSGNGVALFQVIDPTSGTVAPDWTVAANQPIIQIGARSASGYPVTITNVTWAFDGTNLAFVYNGDNWVTATNDSRFKARIVNGKYQLRICANIASLNSLGNKQLAYEVNYSSNAMTERLNGSVDILVQSGGSDSHMMQITTNRVELDSVNTTATLTAVGYYGTSPVTIGQNGYTIEWYKDGVQIAGQTGNTLTVTREMVVGANLFIAKLKLNGNLVAQDSQRVSDIADEYQVGYQPHSAAQSACSYKNGVATNAVFDLSVLRNGVAISSSVTYEWQLYNSMGVEKGSGTGAQVTVTPADCLVAGNLYADDAVYGDCDVSVQAEFTS